MSSEICVISRTQKIIVDSASSSIAVINAGAQGPAGPAGGITTEEAVDATAAALAAGTHTNVTVTYDDTANSISLAASGSGGGGSSEIEVGPVPPVDTTMLWADTTDEGVSLIGPAGADGEKGDPGEPGGSILSAFWQYNSTTTSPPGSGQIRTNSPITTLWINETDTDGNVRSAGLATITIDSTVLVRAANGTVMDLLITGTPVDNGTYWTFPVSVISGSVTKGARTQLNFVVTTLGTGGFPSGGYVAETDDWNDIVTDGIYTADVTDSTPNGPLPFPWPDRYGQLVVVNSVESEAGTMTGNRYVTQTFYQPYEPATRIGHSDDDGATWTWDPWISLTVFDGDKGDITVDGDDWTVNPSVMPPVRRPIYAQTGTTFTPAVTDENKMVTLSNAAAITVTLPQNSVEAFPVGAEVDFLWLGVGQPTFSAGTGATVNGTPGLKLRVQYSAATAKKISTNGWVVLGDLSA